MSLLDAEILPELDRLAVGDRRAWFALRLRPRVAASRAGVRVVLAIDRSSSMAGKKLECARLAARVLVHLLGVRDELAIVTFDEQVHVALSVRCLDEAGKAAARLALEGLRAGHGTALFRATQDCLLLAGQMRQGHVILITDGFPYSGITDAAQILAMAAESAGASTLTTIGVGSELDAALLSAMAGVGGGRFLHLDADGELVMALGGELATVLGAVTGKLHYDLRAAPGFTVATVPHYAVLGDASEGRSTASAMLAPAVDSEEIVVPFELAWAAELAPGEHEVGLVSVRMGLPGSTASEVLELPVRLRVGAARGAMDGVVTRAICGAMAGKALHLAALGGDSPAMSARVLSDAAGWIRGRASAAGLELARDLGPMLSVLAVAQSLFESGVVDAPMIHACADGIAKSYDASIGSRLGLMEDLRTDWQREGSVSASKVVVLDPRWKGK